jgi:flagellar hook-associated protein 2
MAIDYLKTLNVGSGLNTSDIIDALANAERAPREAQITKRQDQRSVEISSLGTVKQSFERMKTGLASYEGITGLAATQQGTSLDIEITDAGEATQFSHNIEISTLAAAQTLVFGGFDSETESVGTGSLAFSFGTWNDDGTFSANSDRSDATVTVDNDGDSLAGLAGAINDADIGVTATILKTDEDKYALVLKSREGAAHAMRITATEDSGNTGLADFAYTSVDASTEEVAAADAAFTLDGIGIARESNEISDLIDGVTLTLKAETSAAETIGASYDATVASAAMQLIVEEMNSLMTELNGLVRHGSNGEDGGPLAGDALVRSLRRQFQALSSTPIVGFQDSSVYLADFGVETNRDGSLSFNAETFSKTFDANPDAFAAITNSRITSSSNLVTTSVIGTQPEAGIYAFALAADGSATLDGSAMTESNGSYTISDSDAGDLKLSLVGGGNNATIYVGKSILDTIADFTTNVLRINGELDQKIARFEDDLADYRDEMTQLDERITDLRARYAVRFGAMESVVNSLKNTEQAIDSMMEAWRASLKN